MRDALRVEADLEPVEVQHQASHYHQAKWKTVIEQSLGHKSRYLLATRRERIADSCPLRIEAFSL